MTSDIIRIDKDVKKELDNIRKEMMKELGEYVSYSKAFKIYLKRLKNE